MCVAELITVEKLIKNRCSLAKISMVAELIGIQVVALPGCSLAKISMVAERILRI